MQTVWGKFLSAVNRQLELHGEYGRMDGEMSCFPSVIPTITILIRFYLHEPVRGRSGPSKIIDTGSVSCTYRDPQDGPYGKSFFRATLFILTPLTPFKSPTHL